MTRRRLIAVLRTFAIVALAVSVAPQPVPAQKAAPAKKENPPPKPPNKAGTPTPYNPYPPGILPADLESELDRVRREVTFIYQQAVAQWHALPPPNLTGQPPTLQGSGYDMVQTLGKLMNFDRNISPFKNQACASCHMPYAGFSGPIPSVNLTMIAYPGSFRYRAGKRTAQRYTYAPCSRYFSSTKRNSCSSAETSGTHAQPATCSRILTPSRRNILRSILRNTVSRTRRASCSGSPRPSTDLSSSRCGAWVRSISSSRPTPRRSAQPLEGRRCSAPTPRPSS